MAVFRCSKVGLGLVGGDFFLENVSRDVDRFSQSELEFLELFQIVWVASLHELP